MGCGVSEISVDPAPSNLPQGKISRSRINPEIKSPTEDLAGPKSSALQDMTWLNPVYRDNEPENIKTPEELKKYLCDPPSPIDETLLNSVRGSLMGLALGDALGAHVEFRPHQYLVEHPVEDLQEGGTWGLRKGQFTDDTSMALCLAVSLIVQCGFNPYDQLVRYKWWHRKGYMSSTGQCFDIGAGTKESLMEFERRQQKFADKHGISMKDIDYHTEIGDSDELDTYCSKSDAAGNGGLMRLAPAPLFFFRNGIAGVEYSGRSAVITHGDERVFDACRFYGALIIAAVQREPKKKLLSSQFYKNHNEWFGEKALHDDVMKIANGSYKKKNGYADGIRGKGFVLASLEAALWAFWSDEDSFRTGVLKAINLGDDTDTTAAIYGQLAGAYYGYKDLPQEWTSRVYARDFITCLSKWIIYQGKRWNNGDRNILIPPIGDPERTK